MQFPRCTDSCCVWAHFPTKTIQRSSLLSGFCAPHAYFSIRTRGILEATALLVSSCSRAWLVSIASLIGAKPRMMIDQEMRPMTIIWRAQIIKLRYRDPIYPTIVCRGPENPPSNFPSSWSKKLDQPIFTKGFRSFLWWWPAEGFLSIHSMQTFLQKTLPEEDCLISNYLESSYCQPAGYNLTCLLYPLE